MGILNTSGNGGCYTGGQRELTFLLRSYTFTQEKDVEFENVEVEPEGT